MSRGLKDRLLNEDVRFFVIGEGKPEELVAYARPDGRAYILLLRGDELVKVSEAQLRDLLEQTAQSPQ